MSSDRVVCAQCGANNFATQAACWKCGVALTAAPSAPQAAPGRVPVAASSGESPAALWASLALGALFPVISLPVGLVFLMLDDRRKAQIGWWNIIAGVVGTVINLLIAAATILPTVMSLTRGLPLGAPRTTSLDSEVAPPSLSGIPNAFSPPR